MLEALVTAASIALPALRSDVRHKQEIRHAQRLHTAEAQHARELLAEKMTHKSEVYSTESILTMRRHALGMEVARSLSRREALRDAWQMRTGFLQTMVLIVALVFSTVFVALTQGRVPDIVQTQYTRAVFSWWASNSTAETAGPAIFAANFGGVSLSQQFGVHLWMGSMGVSIASLFVCLWLCMLVQRRVGRYRVLPSLADAGAHGAAVSRAVVPKSVSGTRRQHQRNQQGANNNQQQQQHRQASGRIGIDILSSHDDSQAVPSPMQQRHHHHSFAHSPVAPSAAAAGSPSRRRGQQQRSSKPQHQAIFGEDDEDDNIHDVHDDDDDDNDDVADYNAHNPPSPSPLHSASPARAARAAFAAAVESNYNQKDRNLLRLFAGGDDEPEDYASAAAAGADIDANVDDEVRSVVDFVLKSGGSNNATSGQQQLRREMSSKSLRQQQNQSNSGNFDGGGSLQQSPSLLVEASAANFEQRGAAADGVTRVPVVAVGSSDESSPLQQPPPQTRTEATAAVGAAAEATSASPTTTTTQQQQQQQPKVVVRLRDLTADDLIKHLHQEPTALADNAGAAEDDEDDAADDDKEEDNKNKKKTVQFSRKSTRKASSLSSSTPPLPEFRYLCGHTHHSFNSYYLCHCEALRFTAALLLAVGTVAAVVAAAALHAMLMGDVFLHDVSALLVLIIVVAAVIIGGVASCFFSDQLLPQQHRTVAETDQELKKRRGDFMGLQEAFAGEASSRAPF